MDLVETGDRAQNSSQATVVVDDALVACIVHRSLGTLVVQAVS